MFCVFATMSTILHEFEFLWSIEFISLGHVVLIFTHRALQRKKFSLFFFCHARIIAQEEAKDKILRLRSG